MKRTIISVLLAMLLMIPMGFSDDISMDYLDLIDQLGPVDKVQMGLANSKPLALVGNSDRGCNDAADDMREGIVLSSTQCRDPRDFSFNPDKLTDQGIINIFQASDTSWDYKLDLNYGETYCFRGGRTYAATYHNCQPEDPPEPQCVYEEFDEFTCKGDNVYELTRDPEHECDTDFYKFVTTCNYGCNDGACNPKPEDNKLQCFRCEAGGLYFEEVSGLTTCGQKDDIIYTKSETACKTLRPELFGGDVPGEVDDDQVFREATFWEKFWQWLKELFS